MIRRGTIYSQIPVDLKKHPSSMRNPDGDHITRVVLNDDDKNSYRGFTLRLKNDEKSQQDEADWAMLPTFNNLPIGIQETAFRLTTNKLITYNSTLSPEDSIAYLSFGTAWIDNNQIHAKSTWLDALGGNAYLVRVNLKDKNAHCIKLGIDRVTDKFQPDNEKAFLIVSTNPKLNEKSIAETMLKYHLILDNDSLTWDFIDIVEMFSRMLPNEMKENTTITVVPVTSTPVAAVVFNGDNAAGHKGHEASLRLKEIFFPTFEVALKEAHSLKHEKLTQLQQTKTKENFLIKLKNYLSEDVTREDILALFQDIKNKNGRYSFIHDNKNKLWDSFRLFFKYNLNNEEKFWHTATYQEAVKLMKDVYCDKDLLLDSTKNNKEQEFINYFRGNSPVHLDSKTSTYRKFYP